MRTALPPKYTWTDGQRTAAVGGSACWRDVMRALGIATSSKAGTLGAGTDARQAA